MDARRRLFREASLAPLAALTLLGAVAVVAQADLLARVLAEAFHGRPVPVPWFAALTGVVAVRALLSWARTALARRTATNVKERLRHRALTSGGGSATLLTKGVDALDPFFTGYLPRIVAAVLVPPVVLLRLGAADWIAAVTVLVTLPLIPVFGALVGMHTRDRTARQWGLLERLGGHFLDVVAGLPALRAYGRDRYQTTVVREMAEAHRAATMGTLKVAFLSSLVLELVATLSVALVAVPVGLRLMDGGVGLETALLVLFLTPEVYLPLRAVGASFHGSAEGLSVARDVYAVVDAPAPATGTRRPPPRPILRLDRVVVDRPGMDAMSLSLSPGERVALTGPSGIGKSTLLAVLLGLVEPDGGRVLVDGVDLAELDLAAWRSQIAWVPQHPHLFAASVADNIRLGAPDATLTEVRAAARAAAADAFLTELPHGYDTVLGENGAGLSTGQRQRVALARAFLRDAPILLLDEPTAHLDPESEAAVLSASAALMENRTALVVAHRPALLDHVDRVVTLGGTA